MKSRCRGNSVAVLYRRSGGDPQDPHPSGLWQIKARPRPVAHAPPDLAVAPFDDWPAPSAEDYLTDPLYPDEV